jgi:Zn-finger protein
MTVENSAGGWETQSYKDWYEKNIKGRKAEYDYSHRFFQNNSCEFFPCHSDIPEKEFSCLMCYCPLYLVPDCIGIQECKGTYLSNGVKDCSLCSIPHERLKYDLMMEQLSKYTKII